MSLRPRVQYTQYRGHRIITPPSVEPITVNDALAHMNLTSDETQGQLVELYIQAAREQAETYMGRALITQEWRLTLDRWPVQGEAWWDGVMQGAISELRRGRDTWVILPRHPLLSVDEITVFDDAGNPEDVPVSQFIVDTQQEPGRMVLKSSNAWPIALQSANAIQVDYTAGYGPAGNDVPAAITLGLLNMVASMYEHRGDHCSAEDAMRQSGAQAIFDRFRVRKL